MNGHGIEAEPNGAGRAKSRRLRENLTGLLFPEAAENPWSTIAFRRQDVPPGAGL